MSGKKYELMKGNLKIAEFEFLEWMFVGGKDGIGYSRFHHFDDSLINSRCSSEIALYPPERNRNYPPNDKNWFVEFYGRFGERFERFEDIIDFLPTDTREEAQQKVDEALKRIEKLESFK